MRQLARPVSVALVPARARDRARRLGPARRGAGAGADLAGPIGDRRRAGAAHGDRRPPLRPPRHPSRVGRGRARRARARLPRGDARRGPATTSHSDYESGAPDRLPRAWSAIGAVVVAVGARRSVREGVLLGASAGLFWAASDTSIKALSGELGDSSWAVIVFSPLAVVIAARLDRRPGGLGPQPADRQGGAGDRDHERRRERAHDRRRAARLRGAVPRHAARRGAAPVRVRAGDRGRRAHPGARSTPPRPSSSRRAAGPEPSAYDRTHGSARNRRRSRQGPACSATSSSSPAPRTRHGSTSRSSRSSPGRELESHVHEAEDDAFYILEGELTFTLAGDEVSAGPGTFVLVPPGVEHGFRNDGAPRCGCSTSTPRPGSTGASASPD